MQTAALQRSRRRLVQLRRNRCGVILASLCMFILADPLLLGSAISTAFVGLGGVTALMLCLWPLRLKRLLLWSFVLAVFLVAEVLVELGISLAWAQPTAHAAAAVFSAATVYALLRHVMDQRPIDADKVFGAVSAYVMIAVLFATLFSLLQLLQPSSFYINQANSSDGSLDWSDLMYFSFTVLTSTGFGEITPVTHMARSLIVVEQVLGVMYVAFLIARLANMYQENRVQRRS